MMSKMFDDKRLSEMLEQILAADKLFDLSAKIAKKSVEVFMANGFSRKEAITIFAGQGHIVKGS
jgi:hypothetical protein